MVASSRCTQVFQALFRSRMLCDKCSNIHFWTVDECGGLIRDELYQPEYEITVLYFVHHEVLIRFKISATMAVTSVQCCSIDCTSTPETTPTGGQHYQARFLFHLPRAKLLCKEALGLLFFVHTVPGTNTVCVWFWTKLL